MIRASIIMVMLFLAGQVSAEPVIADVTGQVEDGAALSILGSGFGDMVGFDSSGQAEAPDSPAKVFLSSSAVYPDSLASTQPVQIPLEWSSEEITIQLQAEGFSTGEVVYLYVVDSKGEYNAQGFPLDIPSEPTGPGAPGKPVISR